MGQGFGVHNKSHVRGKCAVEQLGGRGQGWGLGVEESGVRQ
jgi:hypothetical protein